MHAAMHATMHAAMHAAVHVALPERPADPGGPQRGIARFLHVAVAKLEHSLKRRGPVATVCVVRVLSGLLLGGFVLGGWVGG